MRKLALLFTFLISSFIAQAWPHNRYGGCLSYEYVGNGKFVFHLEFLVDCSTTGYSLGYNLGGVNVQYVGSTPADELCDTSSSCYLPDGTEKMMIQHYVSDTTTVLSPNPGSYREFSVNVSYTRVPTVNYSSTYSSIILVARMYPNGFPRSSARVDLRGSRFVPSQSNQRMNMPSYVDNGDSLYHELSSVRATTNLFGTYAPGYSYSSPFMRPFTLNSSTGTVMVDSLIPGASYVVAQKVSSYFQGALSSEVDCDRVYTVDSLTSVPRTYPNVNFSFNRPVSFSADQSHIRAFVPKGDSLLLQMFCTDPEGDPVDAQWDSYFVNGPAPTFTPQAGWANPSALSSLGMNLNWKPDSSTVSGIHRAILRFRDNSCPRNVRTYVVDLLTDDIGAVPRDTLRTCTGCPVEIPAFNATGDLKWYPYYGLNNAYGFPCVIAPYQDNLYTLYSDGVPVYEVYFEVIAPPPPVVDFVSNQFRVVDPRPYNNFDWYLWNVHVDSIRSELDPSVVSGEYWARTQVDYCVKKSNTYSNALNSEYKAFVWGDEIDLFETMQVSDQFGFGLIRNGNSAQWMQQLILPGVRVDQDDVLRLQVYRDNQLEYVDTFETRDMYSSVVYFPPSNQLVDLLMTRNVFYRFEIECLSGHVDIPFGDSLDVSVTNTKHGFRLVNAMNSLGQSGSIPFVLKTTNGVGVSEENRMITWYPNPCRDEIHLEGIEEGAAFSITDASGRTVLQGIVDDSHDLHTSALLPGMYILHVNNMSFKLVHE